MSIRSIINGIAFITVLLATACKKEKADNVNPSSQDALKVSNSNIRLFNFTDYDVDMAINNIPLTAYGVKDGFGSVIAGTGNVTKLGLQYFPKEAWKAAAGGSPFILPTFLLDKNGNAQIRLTINQKTIDTTILNNTLQPKDYYLFRRVVGEKDAFNFVILNREANPPAVAQNFKIRILNYQQNQDPLGLTGPVTLTFADGTPVSPLLSNIAPNTASAYVELPYGAYQFKLFGADGASIDVTKQLTELPVQPDFQSQKPLPQPQEGIIVPVRTYKPGGAYTMLLSPAAMIYNDKYDDGAGDVQKIGVNMNVYRVVTDINPDVNFSFARVQAANALPGAVVNVLIDGTPVGEQLDFGKNSGYSILTRGEHTVSITNAAGKKLAEKPLTLYPYDNYTVWATLQADGSAGILFSAVNMTATSFDNYGNNTGGDGSGLLRKQFYTWSTRFLNLSPDVPAATFTNDNALLIDYDAYYHNLPAPATYNILSNKAPDIDPFLSYGIGKKTLGTANPANIGQGSITTIRAYESTPGKYPELPGRLLMNVTPVNVKDQFIANKALYTSESLKPWAELGVYTVALIGRTGTGVPATEKARMIVIKHNK
ncbi:MULTISPECIES: DUF4397 domain-containing protein [unclassified Chitinophaga]|uniref:DUF4397 domain-containing protein n=1 Tax=unclassified Chitinophaga TaxID=2619133 RepID=UPI003010439C